MKIQSITATNIFGVQHVDVALTTPITLFAGHNGQGKSSLAQAVRMAMTGKPSRVSLKKDFGALVREGAKKGSAVVRFANGTEASVTVPKGEWVEEYPAHITVPRLEAVLEPGTFARMSADERRNFLFDLTGLRISQDAVRERLTRRGCDMEKAEAVMPLLRTGFPAAHKGAAERATEARGAWKAITGETYGSQKAEGWEAPRPAFDADQLTTLREGTAKVEAELDSENQQLGALENAQSQADQHAERIDALREKAADVPRLLDLVERAHEDLADFKPRVEACREAATGESERPSMGCPECGSALIMVAGQLQHYTPPSKTPDREAQQRLPELEKALGVLERTLSNRAQELETAQRAAITLQELESSPGIHGPDQGDIERSRARRDALRESLADLRQQVAELESAERAAASADSITEQAARHHADVLAWVALAEAFAPDGIPGEMLADALNPVNGRLRQSADDTGWMQIAISSDMDITASGRPYALLSESEQWRADAMLAEAISTLSGLRLLMLDRLDVLDTQQRIEAINWLTLLAEDGDLETALVFATLKSAPGGLPAAITAHWMERGTIAAQKEREAA